MKRLYIVVEGQTEQEFVNSVAAPYLNKKGILDARPILIRTSRTGRGGMDVAGDDPADILCGQCMV